MSQGYISIERVIVIPQPQSTSKVNLYDVTITLGDETGEEYAEISGRIATYDGPEEAAYRLYLEEQSERRARGLPEWDGYEIRTALYQGSFISTMVRTPAVVYQRPPAPAAQEGTPADAA